MPLDKQNFTLSFSTGIDTKVDPKQVVPGTLQSLENVVFDEIGAFRKRNGYDSLTLNVLNDTAISNPRALATYKDELLLLNDSNLYSISSTVDKWINKGELRRVFSETSPIIRNAYTQSNPDAVCINDIGVYVWEDSRGGIRYTVMDGISKTTFAKDIEVSSTGSRPKLSNIGNIIYIFYVDGTDIKYRKINPIKPATLGAEFTPISNLDATNKHYDTQAIGNEIYIAYETSIAGGQLGYLNIDDNDNVSSLITKVGESASNCVNIQTDVTSNIVVTYSDGTDVKYNMYNFGFASELVVPTTIETISSIDNITSVETSTGNYIVFYEQSAASAKDHRVRTSTFTDAGSVGTPADSLRSVGLQSNAFTVDGSAYVVCMHESEFQSTYFTIDSSGKISNKSSAGIGGVHRQSSSLAEISDLGNSKYLVATQVKSKVISEDSEFFTSLGVQAIELDFASDTNFQKLSMAGNLHITGGYLQSYDGQSVTEHGFHIYPEDLSQSANAASGGSLVDGTYNYVAIYAWTDTQGLKHRSAPSIGLVATASAGGSAQTLSIDVPTLRITDKENVIIELYRTVKDGTIFHKVTTVASPEVNDPTIDSITITDGISDTDLISNELLYTTGGILENVAPSSVRLMTSFNNRIMLIPGDKPNTLQYSKLNLDGEPVEFSDLLVKRIGRDEEPVTSIATLDDKFILFKNSAMYFISGEGPNNAGTQDTFTEPEIISSDIGCEQQNSIVLTPQGLMFMSNKGIYLLTRGLELQYIGAQVEDFNDQIITSAKVVPATNQVRFTIENNLCLVYDYFINQWSTFSNHSGLDATILNATYYYLNSAGQVYKENKSSYLDAGTQIRIKIETSWISFAGLQGYQRVYKLLGLGEYVSPHKLRIRTAYDFKEVYIHERVIDSTDISSNIRYGDTTPYGNESIYGGEGDIYQFRVDMKKQKTQSIKIKIEEIQESDTIGEGLAISALTFRIGVKPSEFKIDSDKQKGTQ